MRSTRSFLNTRGQSLIEVLVGLAISVVMISAATGSLFLVLRSGSSNEQNQVAGSLATALLENVTVFTEASWANIYNLPKGEAAHHHLIVNAGAFSLVQDTEEIVTVGDIDFTRYFYIENVSRNPDGGSDEKEVQETYDSAYDDPSTQKVTVRVTWGLAATPGSIEISGYLTRWQLLQSAQQTNWVGGLDGGGTVQDFGTKFSSETGIDYSVSGSIKLNGY